MFLIELSKFFSNEEIGIMKEVFRRYMDNGFLLWPGLLDFDSVMIYLNNLHLSINRIHEKAKVIKYEKGNSL